jgi:hypothetical protein
MARRSLKPQLNQIRAWVRQGRTDAWIAHQLEVSTSELREFRKQHGFTPDEEDGSQELDLRDEIEAEIEAATAEEVEKVDEGEDEDADEEAPEDSEEDGDDEGDGEERPKPRRRRRGRRGGRGRRKELEATFDHGETDGYGLARRFGQRQPDLHRALGGAARGHRAHRSRPDRHPPPGVSRRRRLRRRLLGSGLLRHAPQRGV